ncbi:MAG: hypothetical protein H8E33_00340 [Candidatus Cloacimonetes bacterium]|nr:hypothetical protein [Candidatus Cloacimonadota bacterium]
MKKVVFKFCGFWIVLLVFLSACAVPPPPVSEMQLNDAKTAALKLEETVADQNAQIDNLKAQLEEKDSELQKLKEYEQQLKDEGFLEEE